MTITFVIGPLALDRPAVQARLDVLLGVVADFVILLEGRRWLREEMFPVLELVASLIPWLDDVDRGAVRDFSYESLEAAEGPLIEFLRHGVGWRVRSPWQAFEEERVLATEEVRDAARQLVDDVRRAAASTLNLDVDRWIARPT